MDEPDRTAQRLIECWQHWADQLEGLADDRWEAPTRCGTWTVRALATHVAPDPQALEALPTLTLDREPAVADAATLLRAFNEPGAVAHTMAAAVAADAVARALELTPAAIVERFRVAAAVIGAAPLSPHATLPHPVVSSVTAAVLAEVSLLEATVHGLDLAAATGCAPPPAAALGAVSELLVRMAGYERFIDVATGRSAERLFPLLR